MMETCRSPQVCQRSHVRHIRAESSCIHTYTSLLLSEHGMHLQPVMTWAGFGIESYTNSASCQSSSAERM